MKRSVAARAQRAVSRTRLAAQQLPVAAAVLLLANVARAHPSAAPHLHEGDASGLLTVLVLLLLAAACALALVVRLRARAGEGTAVRQDVSVGTPRRDSR